MISQTLFYINEEDPASAFAAHDLLGRAFWATLLLTGDVVQAEAAVLHAITSSELDPLSDETFLTRGVTAAVSGTETTGEQRAAAQSILPLELRRVSTLPTGLRHCFVLRTLVGFTREACAQLLNLTAEEFDEALCEAVKQLVRLSR